MNFLYGDSLPASGTVVLDGSIGASAYGNYLSIPYAPSLTSRSAGFSLYIDGKLIASDKVTYSLPGSPSPVSLKEIGLAAASVVGGAPVQGTVTLTGAAPAGGVTVALRTDNPAATVPANVTVAGGQSSAQFTITTTAVTAGQFGVVVASFGSLSKAAALSANPPPVH